MGAAPPSTADVAEQYLHQVGERLMLTKPLKTKGDPPLCRVLLRHLHTDAVTLKKLVSTMLMSELIEDEVLTNGKVVYSLRNAA